MKKLLATVFLLLFLSNVQATNYYVSNSGDDANSGTSETTPFKTITKLNTIILQPGDTVFFKAGEVFRGTIVLKQGGNATSGITFTSYGTGEKPIISGAEPVTSWVLNGNLYQANFTQAVTSLFINNQEMTIARYPNDHSYLTLDSGQTSYLKDADITSLSSDLLTNAKICIHTAQWCWEKTEISSVSGDQINFKAPVQLVSLSQYGYFLYGNLSHLDIANEWYYDSTTQTLSFISNTDPNTLNSEASIYTNGIEFKPNVSYVTVSQIAFEKQTNAGVTISGTTNKYIKIDNCTFKGQYNFGVNDKGQYNEISNNTFNDVDGIAVFLDGKTGSGNAVIHHNTFKNIGQFRNYGTGSQINLSAIKLAFVDNCHIHHNDIDGAGYFGISVDGGYTIVEKNIIKNAMLLNNDGGALHSYGAGSHDIIFRNNFVSTSDGNTEGTYKAMFITPAIYFDFNVNNCTVQDNTVYNRTQKGIFLNSGSNNNKIMGNTIHGFNVGIDFNGSLLQTTPMTGMEVTGNVFFAKDPSAYMVRMLDNTGGYKQGTIDNNYYFQPYSATSFAFLPPSSAITFSTWQATGLDTNSKSSFVNWTLQTADETLYMNPSDNELVVDLGTSQYLDLDNNIVCGTITLQPYTSKILINNNTECQILGVGAINTIEDTVSIYPNPSSSEITINVNSVNINNDYSIYNQLGQLVSKGVIVNGKATLSVSEFPMGIYFIHVGSEITKKFIRN